MGMGRTVPVAGLDPDQSEFDSRHLQTDEQHDRGFTVAIQTITRSATIEERPSRGPGWPAEINVELFADAGHGTERVAGYSLTSKHRKLAERLASAWKAGAIGRTLVRQPYNAGIVNERTGLTTYLTTDPHGQCKTFEEGRESTHCRTCEYMPMGKTLNADLKRVGF
jgi:hypothetical protein